MKEKLTKFIEDRSPGSKPLLLVIRGSHAYGTNIETSDTDYAGVFIQGIDDILGNQYKEQINDDTNDIVIYEIRRFLELLGSNNPTVLELLNTPEDCIIYKHPIFDLVLKNRDKFITKGCGVSFGGYSRQQILKARGQNKKQNWETDRVTKKGILDFCSVIDGHNSIPLTKWLLENGYDQKDCGVVKIPNARDMYALFYSKDIPYKGMSKENSNELRLSSVPRGEKSITTFSYNKDGYSQHCKDYKSYETWLEKRNESRWVDVKSHGQKIDGKNMMHCVRLVEMAREIAEGKGINVRRPNANDLIDIRKGKVDLETLIERVESEMADVIELFKDSDLPDEVDGFFINKLLIEIRSRFYSVEDISKWL